MANTGTPWNLPYPLLTDSPNGPMATQDLAEKTAAGLGYAYPCTSGARPAHGLGRIIHETDTGLLLYSDGTGWWQLMVGDDTGWVDLVEAGFSASANMSLVSGKARRRGGAVSLYATLTTTAGFTEGDVGNTAVMTAPAGWYPGQAMGGLTSGATGGTAIFHVTSAGTFYIVSTATAYGAGATFNMTGTYIL